MLKYWVAMMALVILLAIGCSETTPTPNAERAEFLRLYDAWSEVYNTPGTTFAEGCEPFWPMFEHSFVQSGKYRAVYGEEAYSAMLDLVDVCASWEELKMEMRVFPEGRPSEAAIEVHQGGRTNVCDTTMRNIFHSGRPLTADERDDYAKTLIDGVQGAKVENWEDALVFLKIMCPNHDFLSPSLGER